MFFYNVLHFYMFLNMGLAQELLQHNFSLVTAGYESVYREFTFMCTLYLKHRQWGSAHAQEFCKRLPRRLFCIPSKSFLSGRVSATEKSIRIFLYPSTKGAAKITVWNRMFLCSVL